jgi:hypothetical protein
MQPDLILIPFGKNATAGTIEPIPETAGPGDGPQKATWNYGFPQVTMTPLAAGGIPPQGQDVNGVLNAISEHTVFVGGGGQYKWSTEYVAETGGYSIGDVIQADDGLNSYVSLVNTNTDNFNTAPGSIGVSWDLYAGRKTQDQATEAVSGIAEIATQAEITAGTDDSRIVTPLKLKSVTGGRLIGIQVFSTAGAFTYTPTPGMARCRVRAVGGGGGSAGVNTTPAGQYNVVGGGAAGSYVDAWLTAADIGVSKAVTIGAGGVAGALGLNAGNGGATSLGSLIVCPGGGGSIAYAALVTSAGSISSGGVPGATPTAPVGSIAYAGQSGGYGIFLSTTAVNGAAAGTGGNSLLGTGGSGLVFAPEGYGAGAGGKYNGPSTAGTVGAAGAPGVIIIEEYA